jgi:adenine nucleotide transporter 17
MAKVRIQARSVDAREDLEDDNELLAPQNRHRKHKNVGAVEILEKVWKREGFVGWYQVSTNRFASCLV